MIAFRILSNIPSKIRNGTPIRKQHTPLTRLTRFCKKAQLQMFNWIPNVPLIGGDVKMGYGRTASAWVM